MLPELRPCEGFWNPHDEREEPRVSFREEAIWTPQRVGGKWGFFDADGVVIREATDYWGPADDLVFQIPEMPCALSEVRDLGRSGFIYGGRAHLHYGHFLLETLSRLWFVARSGLQGRKVLLHVAIPLADWYRTPFVKSCLEALGIRESDIVECREPERLRDILIPQPCLQPNAWVRSGAARDLFHKIGVEILKERPVKPNNTPVYLSKSQLRNKGTGIINEWKIDNHMRDLGVEVIYPERLSFGDQVLLFKSRRVILGALGSAFHTAAFAQPAARMIILAHNAKVNSNYRLFDLAGGNTPEYYHSSDIVEIGRVDDLPYALRCENPKGIARALVRLADKDGTNRDRMTRRWRALTRHWRGN